MLRMYVGKKNQFYEIYYITVLKHVLRRVNTSVIERQILFPVLLR